MKISNVSTMLLAAPVPEERRWRSDFGLKRRLEAAIVVVETDEGIRGYGEAKGSPRVVEAIVASRLKPLLIGEDPRRITFLWEKMYSGSRLPLALKSGRPYQGHNIKGETMCAMSGVDVALWDITGKALGVPIHALLGGAVRDRIRAYGSGGWAPPGQAGDELRSYADQGFTAVKMRVGGLDDDDFPGRSIARVREVREAVGDGVEIMVDAHGSLTVNQACHLANAIENVGIAWFEEPVVVDDDLPGLVEVRRRTTIPVATGENEHGRFRFRDIIDAGGADILQPDVAIAGGLTETQRIAALAYAHGIGVAPHVWGSALLWAASLQMAAAIPNVFIFEFCQAYNPFLYDLIVEPVAVDADGFVTVPVKPGLGVELQPDLERKYPFAD